MTCDPTAANPAHRNERREVTTALADLEFIAEWADSKTKYADNDADRVVYRSVARMIRRSVAAIAQGAPHD